MNDARHTTRPLRPRTAFTLLEMIVVVTIIGIMATLAVPRLLGNDSRQFKVAVEQVGDLLTMYAQREHLGQKVVGLSHDRTNNAILLVLIDIDPESLGRTSRWRIDPYVKPVRLPTFMSDLDVEFFVDGDRYDASEWPVANDVGKQRPLIQVRLRGADQWATLVLYPHGVAPVISTTYGQSGVVRTPVDLDASGRSREDW